jgi:hypothetical protein
MGEGYRQVRSEVVKQMLSQKNTKNANFLCIMSVLKEMLEAGSITAKEYLRAKKYYLKLTGADIFIAD